MRRRFSILILLSAILIGSIIISSGIGAVDISPIKVAKIFIQKILPSGVRLIRLKSEWTQEEELIIIKVRLPRIYMAALIGMALASSGAAFQGLLRNPLADPYVLGVSSGGALGAIVAFRLGIDQLFHIPTLPMFAFAGSLLTIMVVYNISRFDGKIPTHTLLLAGVIVNSLFSAILMFFISIMGSVQVKSFQFWVMGDLGSTEMSLMLTVSILIFLAVVVLYFRSRELNLLSLGEEAASNLGVEVEREKKIIFVVASLIVGASVSACGMIGFVGLIIPHISRMLLGADHRSLIPSSALIGAIFLIVADTVARSLMAPTELPVGVITAICGAPFFIYLLKRSKKSFF